MINNSWILGIENTIYTIVKTKSEDNLKFKFPSIEFTTSDKAKMTKFPTVYMHMLPINAKTDLENNVNGLINCTFQVEIFSDSSQNDCKKVMYDILDAFCNIGFYPSIKGYSNTTVYRYIVTFSRNIGASDTFN